MLAIPAILFAVIAAAVSSGATMPFDRAILLSLRDPKAYFHPVGPVWLFETMRDITALGSVAVLTVFTLGLAGYWYLSQRRGPAALLIGAAAGVLILNDVLKSVFDRPRPDASLQLAHVFSSGFPSGHSACSAAIYFSAAILLSDPSANRRVRIFTICTAAVLVVLIGFSRIYLGVHYPTDVLAGWCVAAVVTAALFPLLNQMRSARREH